MKTLTLPSPYLEVLTHTYDLYLFLFPPLLPVVPSIFEVYGCRESLCRSPSSFLIGVSAPLLRVRRRRATAGPA